MVEVTQADIDALDVIWKHSLNYGSRHEMEQIVAAHRLDAIAEGRRQMREEAAKLTDHSYRAVTRGTNFDLVNRGRNTEARKIGEAIRAIPIGDE